MPIARRVSHHRPGHRHHAVEEFTVVRHQPSETVAYGKDAVLRSILARHRCRLTFLEEAEEAAPSPSAERRSGPLSSFSLARRRVRVTGADQASVRRCCRQLSAKLPEFASRVPAAVSASGGSLGSSGTAPAGCGVVADARLSLLCRRRKSCGTFQPLHLLSNPALRSILKTGRPPAPNGDYDCVTQASSAAGKSSHIGYLNNNDSYSQYFTDNDGSVTFKRPSNASRVSSRVQSDKSDRTVTCATVTIRIGDGDREHPAGANNKILKIHSTEKSVPPAVSRPRSYSKGYKKYRDNKCVSRGRKLSIGYGGPKVADVSVQTSPAFLMDAGKSISSYRSDLPPLSAKFDLGVMPQSVDCCSAIWNNSERHNKLTNNSETRLKGGRMRGKIAHRRVTWYLRASRRAKV